MQRKHSGCSYKCQPVLPRQAGQTIHICMHTDHLHTMCNMYTHMHTHRPLGHTVHINFVYTHSYILTMCAHYMHISHAYTHVHTQTTCICIIHMHTPCVHSHHTFYFGVVLRGLYGMPGIEPRLATYKANALPAAIAPGLTHTHIVDTHRIHTPFIHTVHNTTHNLACINITHMHIYTVPQNTHTYSDTHSHRAGHPRKHPLFGPGFPTSCCLQCGC